MLGFASAADATGQILVSDVVRVLTRGKGHTFTSERKRQSTRPFRYSVLLLSLLFLAACGGDDGGAPNASSLTVAYVETECHEGVQGLRSRQALRIRRGDNAPITLKELTLSPDALPPGICALLGRTRFGRASVVGGAFQRLGITADGSGVVFEVTDDFSFFAPNKVVAPEEEGIFFVRTDGSGLRPLGPADGSVTVELPGPAVYAPY